MDRIEFTSPTASDELRGITNTFRKGAKWAGTLPGTVLGLVGGDGSVFGRAVVTSCIGPVPFEVLRDHAADNHQVSDPEKLLDVLRGAYGDYDLATPTVVLYLARIAD